MANPVFNRLEKEWSPSASNNAYAHAGPAGARAGYPQQTNPDYPQGYGAGAGTRQGAMYDPAAFQQAQQAYYGPAATQADMGRMTYDDVIVKTAVSLAVLVGAGAVTWMLTMANPDLGWILMIGGFLVGLVLAMINIFSKTIRPVLVLGYAAAEGVALGALSAVTQMVLPGVVIQAVVATAVVFAVTLALFTSGKVRNSPKLMKFTLISLVGIIASRILIWVMGSFGWLGVETGGYNISILGIPLPIAISIFAVLIGAFCLISDFDQARVGVESGAPAIFAWSCAFAIMVTVVWLYVEILRIVSYLNSNN